MQMIEREKLTNTVSYIKNQLREKELYRGLGDQLLSGIATLRSTRDQSRITIFEIHHGRQWEKYSDSFDHFCKVYLPFISRSSIFRELNAARFEKANGLDFGTISESTLRSISFRNCSDKELCWIWKNATKKKKKPTAEDIKQSFHKLKRKQEAQKFLKDKEVMKEIVTKSDRNDLAELVHLALDAVMKKQS